MPWAHSGDTSRYVLVVMAEYTVGSVSPVNCRMGAEAAMAPSTDPGYFMRSQDDNIPGVTMGKNSKQVGMAEWLGPGDVGAWWREG